MENKLKGQISFIQYDQKYVKYIENTGRKFTKLVK